MRNLKDIIADLEAVQLNTDELSLAFQKIRKYLVEIFDHPEAEIKQTTLTKGSSLFRARPLSKDRLFSNPSELSVPPKDKTDFGRLNLARKPVYYCSESVTTSILEMKPKVGDGLTLLESKLISDINVSVLGNCERYVHASEISDDLRVLYNYITPLINQLVNTNEKHKYLKTAQFGDFVLSDYNYKGILYPSFYTRTNSDNLALRANEVEHVIKFERVRHFEIIEKTNEFNLKIKCIAKSDKLNSDGKFHWEKVINCGHHEIKDRKSVV